ncbi:energy transducer TonB [Aquimonas sp.]|jgi:protein TonB|uniref:energy transducer TonB n=1 Tax=Aquimonas sp. TaxID=1872588 RepID=UPI0037C0D078
MSDFVLAPVRVRPGHADPCGHALRWRLVQALLACVLIGGCSSEPEPSAPPTAPDGRVATAAESGSSNAPAPEVLQRAEAALRAQRLFAPPGDNAFELFLQVLESSPSNVMARDALQDLFPYAVLHVEQRLAARDRAEVSRLLPLLASAQPEAPALPRLQRGLQALDSTPRPADTTAIGSPPASPTIASTMAAAPPAVPAAPVEQASAAAADTADSVGSSAPDEPAALAIATPSPASAAGPITQPAAAAVAAPAPAPAAASPDAEVTMPKVLRQSTPLYPTLAARRKQEGMVELAFTISTSGRVTDLRVLRSEPPGVFDRVALTAMEDWRYEAPNQDIRATRTFEFKMD